MRGDRDSPGLPSPRMEAGLVVPPRALPVPWGFSRESLYSDVLVADLPEAGCSLVPRL